MEDQHSERRARTVRSSRVSVIALLCCLPAPAFAQTGVPAAPAPVRAIDTADIVVTAQKREQRLQDVPSSISAVSAEALERKGATRLTDLTKVVSGLQVVGGAAPGQGKATIRGISSGTDRVALVGLYLDDVPFTAGSSRTTAAGRNLAFDPSLADIERIEVLKGPQSTLYGASTMGGLIKYVSKRPDLTQFEGSARVGVSQIDGGGGGYSARLSVNVPLSVNFALRASAFYREDPGFLTEISRNEHNANRGSAKGVRGTLLFDSGDFENLLTGFVQSISSKEAYDVFVTAPTLNFLYGRPAYLTPIRQDARYTYHSVANTSTLKLPFATITNIASYSGVFSSEILDVSAFTGTDPNIYATGSQPKNIKRLSDEFRVASTKGRFEWLLGAWYTHEKFDSLGVNHGTDKTGALLPISNPYYNLYNLTNHATFEEWAFFGNGTFHITPELEAAGGIRYSQNKQNFSAVGAGLIANQTAGFVTRDSSVDYLATITYKPSSTLSLYLRAASAYRPGGPNNVTTSQIAAGVPTSFKSDKLWNYEAGLKGSLLNREVRYEASIYHMNWSDIQVNQLFPLSTGGSFSATANIGKAVSDGAEVSLSFDPTRQISLGVNASYNNARIAADAPTLGAVSGNPLPYAPKFSSNVFADFRTRISENVEGSLGATYAVRTDQKAGFQKSKTPYTLPAYGTLDLRAGIAWARYRLNVTIDNVINTNALTYVNTSNYKGSQLAGYIVQPRIFGMSLDIDF